MRGWLITVAVFLVCLVAVRGLFGVNEELKTSDLLAYFGAFEENTTPLRDVIAEFNEIYDQCKELLNPKAGRAGGVGGSREDFDKTTEERLQDFIDLCKLAIESLYLTIKLVAEFGIMIINDIILLLRVAGYLVLGIK